MKKRNAIENMLLGIYANIGMDKPENHEDILDFVVNDVEEAADPKGWHSGDVAIAFRRWIESKSNVNDEKTAQAFLKEYFRGSGYSNEIDYIRCMVAYANSIAPNVQSKNNYFNIVAQGYNEELMREEIQIHAGENGNVFLIKTDEGFIVDVYNQEKHLDSLCVWEEDLMSDDEDSDADIVFEFKYQRVKAFIEKWGKTEEDVYLELELDEKNITEIGDAYFFEDTSNLWIPKMHPEYNEEEQAIADYLQQPVT